MEENGQVVDARLGKITGLKKPPVQIYAASTLRLVSLIFMVRTPAIASNGPGRISADEEQKDDKSAPLS